VDKGHGAVDGLGMVFIDEIGHGGGEEGGTESYHAVRGMAVGMAEVGHGGGERGGAQMASALRARPRLVGVNSGSIAFRISWRMESAFLLSCPSRDGLGSIIRTVIPGFFSQRITAVDHCPSALPHALCTRSKTAVTTLDTLWVYLCSVFVAESGLFWGGGKLVNGTW